MVWRGRAANPNGREKIRMFLHTMLPLIDTSCSRWAKAIHSVGEHLRKTQSERARHIEPMPGLRPQAAAWTWTTRAWNSVSWHNPCERRRAPLSSQTPRITILCTEFSILIYIRIKLFVSRINFIRSVAIAVTQALPTFVDHAIRDE